MQRDTAVAGQAGAAVPRRAGRTCSASPRPRWPPRTPRCASCCTGCPAWTRWARRSAPPPWPPGRSSGTPSCGRWTPRSAMVDLTTLEGADTPGKVRGLCAKARQPDPADHAVPPVAAVCVYPDLVAVARERAGRQRREGRLGGHRVPVRPRLAGGQAGRRGRRGRGGRRRGRHGHRPGGVPGRPVRAGRRGDPGGPRRLRPGPPQGHPGDRGAGHPGQRGPGLLAGHAVRGGLHQDLDRQGVARPRPRRSPWSCWAPWPTSRRPPGAGSG